MNGINIENVTAFVGDNTIELKISESPLSGYTAHVSLYYTRSPPAVSYKRLRTTNVSIKRNRKSFQVNLSNIFFKPSVNVKYSVHYLWLMLIYIKRYG